jgi:hypothetical protein
MFFTHTDPPHWRGDSELDFITWIYHILTLRFQMYLSDLLTALSDAIGIAVGIGIGNCQTVSRFDLNRNSMPPK